ncbi:MAG: NAD-dependent epimerase/dehydratase family protein [Parafilimonas sp.]
MKYIIFGAGGFLGKELVNYLQSENQEVIAVQKKDLLYSVDITNAESFESLKHIEKVDIIINSVSILPNAALSNDAFYLKNLFETNTIGAVNILHFAAAQKIKKIINCSTLAIINKPWPVPLKETDVNYPGGVHTGYAVSKLSQELLMNEISKQLSIELLHLRLSALYGVNMKWSGILPVLIEKLSNNEKVFLADAEKNSFDFLFTDDLVKIIKRLSDLEKWSYNTVNTASAEEIFLKKIADEIVAQTTSISEITYSETDSPASRSVINIDRLREMLNNDFYFTPLAEGIKKIIADRKN